MKNQKLTFIILLILLIIFLPISIISTTMHLKYNSSKEENPEHAFQKDGKLFFYDNDTLIGTYTCESIDGYCDYAAIKEKKEYALDENISEKVNKLNLIENHFAFLMDTEDIVKTEIILYDVVNSKIYTKYKEVKNYEVGIEGNIYILKNDRDQWGVLDFNDGVNLKIPFQYDYIGLPNRVTTSGKIDASAFAVLKDQAWKLVDQNNYTLTTTFTEEIYSYNNSIVALKGNNLIHLVDYAGNNYMTNYYNDVRFFDKYISVLDTNNDFYILDSEAKQIISNTYPINSMDDVNIKLNNNNIAIYKDDILMETIAINENIG